MSTIEFDVEHFMSPAARARTPRPDAIALPTSVVPLEIVRRVAFAFGLTVDDVTGDGRTRTVAAARHVAIWCVREARGASYTELGRLFCRDHTTCLSSVAVVKRWIADGDDLGRRAERLAREWSPSSGGFGE